MTKKQLEFMESGRKFLGDFKALGELASELTEEERADVGRVLQHEFEAVEKYLKILVPDMM